MSIPKRFSWYTTAEQVVEGCDLTSKTYLITGSTGGLGFEGARVLASKGAEVIISGRSDETCNKAKAAILLENPKARLSTLPINLESLESVKNAAEKLLKTHTRLDCLILNAGVVGLDAPVTIDGFETTFQVNHLSHFYLVLLLESMLQKGSRVIIVSSISYGLSFLTFESLSFERLLQSNRWYWFNKLILGMPAYNDSKLCNLLHGYELSDRLYSRGVDVMILHPGTLVSTPITRHSRIFQILFFVTKPFVKNMEQASATTVYCATAPELTGCTGRFFEDCYIAEHRPKEYSKEFQEKLWNLSMAALRGRGFILPEGPTWD